MNNYYGSHIVEALKGNPMTISDIALKIGQSVRAVRDYLYVLTKFPKKVHVCNWEFSEVQKKHVPVYKAGEGDSMTLNRFLARNGMLPDTMAAKIIKVISVNPMSIRDIAEKLDAKQTTVASTITRLRKEPKRVCVAKYESAPDMRFWVKVFGMGSKDAKYPTQRRPKAAKVAKMVMKSTQPAQSWMSALGSL